MTYKQHDEIEYLLSQYQMLAHKIMHLPRELLDEPEAQLAQVKAKLEGMKDELAKRGYQYPPRF